MSCFKDGVLSTNVRSLLRPWRNGLCKRQFQTTASEVNMKRQWKVIKYGKPDRSTTTARRDSSKKGTFANTKNRSRTIQCHVCHETDHDTCSFEESKSLGLPKRWDRAKQLGLYFRCLDIGHLGKNSGVWGQRLYIDIAEISISLEIDGSKQKASCFWIQRLSLN